MSNKILARVGPEAEGWRCMQGLLQAWNFNQPEALRAFKMAEEADPSAPMVYFGQAYALGPGANRHASHATCQRSFILAEPLMQSMQCMAPDERLAPKDAPGDMQTR